MVRRVLITLVGVALGCAPSAMAAEGYSLGTGEAVFWSGPGGGAASCGDRCWEYGLEVRETAWRLRVGIDHATVGDVWTARVIDPSGATRTTFSPEAGLYSQEGMVDDPAPGRWKVEVTAAPEVGDLRFRLRARLERQPQLPVPAQPVLPNLQALPPYMFTFDYPVTNGTTDGAPQGAPVPAGRTSCHPEEVAEEHAQRCLRMAFGVRNTGQGPMRLFFDDPGTFADAVLMQHILWTDGHETDRVAGVAKYHKTHQHYHHDKAIGLTLLKVTNPLTGDLQPAAPEHLKGFAHRNELLREWTVFYPTWDGDGDGFGLRPGWGDYYEWDRPGNYIDFGLNTDGRYVLRMVADPVAGILESNETDNASYTLIDIAGATVTWLESGRGTDPWDRCKILMPMGAEPGDPGAAQPPRPADCPPDTIDAPGVAAPAPAVVVAPKPVAATKKKPAAKKKKKAKRKRCVKRKRGSKRKRACRRR